MIEKSCIEFTNMLASASPVPGGGGASAMVGAIGMALGNMVGSLTLGKKKYADVQEEIIALKGQADSLQTKLLALVQKDADVFEPLAKAYGIPKDDPSRTEVMEAALKLACSVPLAIMENCCKAIDLHQEFAAKGTAIAISDVGVGVAFCKAALLGASLNVFINTKGMTDLEYADKINRQANAMLATYTVLADDIYAAVARRLVG
jgi:formiminotetrahydrofolate cyclodeaminase